MKIKQAKQLAYSYGKNKQNNRYNLAYIQSNVYIDYSNITIFIHIRLMYQQSTFTILYIRVNVCSLNSMHTNALYTERRRKGKKKN